MLTSQTCFAKENDDLGVVSCATLHYIRWMISLIINADDLGANRERDRGIIEAFEQGIVTSASLLANGASFETAAEQAMQAALPVGVHLNLSEGTALNGPIQGLTDQRGRFPGKARTRDFLLRGEFDGEVLRQELRAQIDRVMGAELLPDHLDSHQHCQIFPGMTEMFIALAKEVGIGALRCPCPAEPSGEDPGGSLGEELALYRKLKTCTDKPPTQLFRPDGLWGMPLLNRLDTARLCALLTSLPPGTWELMTHPGYPAPEAPFSGPERQVELAALTSPECAAIIRQRDIRLCSFGEGRCAS